VGSSPAPTKNIVPANALHLATQFQDSSPKTLSASCLLELKLSTALM
jgi:hypothetical protein